MPDVYYPRTGDTIYDAAYNVSGSLAAVDAIIEQNVNTNVPMVTTEDRINGVDVSEGGFRIVPLGILNEVYTPHSLCIYFETKRDVLTPTVIYSEYVSYNGRQYAVGAYMANAEISVGIVGASNITIPATPNTKYHIVVCHGLQSVTPIGDAPAAICGDILYAYINGAKYDSSNFPNKPNAVDISAIARTIIARPPGGPLLVKQCLRFFGILRDEDIIALYNNRDNEEYRIGNQYRLSPTIKEGLTVNNSYITSDYIQGIDGSTIASSGTDIIVRPITGEDKVFRFRLTNSEINCNSAISLGIDFANYSPASDANKQIIYRAKFFNEDWINIFPNRGLEYENNRMTFNIPGGIQTQYLDIEVDARNYEIEQQDLYVRSICYQTSNIIGEYLIGNAVEPVTDWPTTENTLEQAPLNAYPYEPPIDVSFIIPFENDFETYTPTLVPEQNLNTQRIPITNQPAVDRAARVSFNSNYPDKAAVDNEMNELEELLKE